MGPVGTFAYINMSGQFHSNDVAMINLGVATAAAAVTGGAAGILLVGVALPVIGGVAAAGAAYIYLTPRVLSAVYSSCGS